uniref:Uncharacterized protein n=1 Tax=Trypanosoma congolense (strain IL3000) TaxID=1068625 RepID=G0UUE2_TRYCI|nr:hypothetical protein, unlikely [Trypanosoma congolense IL3000]
MSVILSDVARMITAGGFCVSSFVCAILLLLCWVSCTSHFWSSFSADMRLKMGDMHDLVLRFTLIGSLRHMNMENFICLALLILLVVLVTLVEEVLLRLKSELEEGAKLPPVDLVRFINSDYDIGLANSGLAQTRRRKK